MIRDGAEEPKRPPPIADRLRHSAITDPRLMTALVVLVVVAWVATFPYLRIRSDFENLDDVIKAAGLQRKDLVVFDDIFNFRRYSSTDGVVVEEGRVVALRLIGTDLAGLSRIGRLDSLVTLNLYGNSLSSLEGVERLRRLRFLNVEHNELTDIGPLSSLTQLREVYFGENPIAVPVRPVKLGGHYFDVTQEDNLYSVNFETEKLVSSYPNAVLVDDPAASGGVARRVAPESENRPGAVFAIVYDFEPGDYELHLRVQVLDSSSQAVYFRIVALAAAGAGWKYFLRQEVGAGDFTENGGYETLVFKCPVEIASNDVNIIVYYESGATLLFDSLRLAKVDMSTDEKRTLETILKLMDNGTQVFP